MRPLKPLYECLTHNTSVSLIDITKNMKVRNQYIIRINTEDADNDIKQIEDSATTINIIDHIKQKYHNGDSIVEELWIFFEFVGDE